MEDLIKLVQADCPSGVFETKFTDSAHGLYFKCNCGKLTKRLPTRVDESTINQIIESHGIQRETKRKLAEQAPIKPPKKMVRKSDGVPNPIPEAPNPIPEAPNPIPEAPNPIHKAPNPIHKAPNPNPEAPHPIHKAPNPIIQLANPIMPVQTPNNNMGFFNVLASLAAIKQTVTNQVNQVNQVNPIKQKNQNEAKKTWTKMDIIEMCRNEMRTIVARVDEIERVVGVHLESKGKAGLRQVDGTKSLCKGCFKSQNDKGNALKPGNIDLGYLKTLRNSGHEAVRSKLLKNKYCNECKSNKNGYWFDMNNINQMCMICRNCRVVKSTLTCSGCDTIKFMTDHAENKYALHKCLKVLEVTLPIKKVITSYDMDETASIKHEYDVGELGRIDFVAKIITQNDKVILFIIEVLASKQEELPRFCHKAKKAIEMMKPNKTFITTLDVKDGEGYRIEEKLEIFRRWVTLGILYFEQFPEYNLWTFFNNARQPYPHMQADETELFFKKPLVILHAPEGIRSNWEFNVDVFTMVKNTKNTNLFNNVNEQSIAVKEKLFGNMGIEDIQLWTYQLYCIRQSGLDNLRCRSDCTRCNPPKNFELCKNTKP